MTPLRGTGLTHQRCLVARLTWEGVRFLWRTPMRWGGSHVWYSRSSKVFLYKKSVGCE